MANATLLIAKAKGLNNDRYKLVTEVRNDNSPSEPTLLPCVNKYHRTHNFEDWLDTYKEYVDHMYQYIISELTQEDLANIIVSCPQGEDVTRENFARYVYEKSENRRKTYDFFK